MTQVFNDMSVKDTGALMDEAGSVLMTFKSIPGGLGRKMSLMVYDASGKVLCMAAGKDNFTKYSFQVFRPTPSYAKQSADDKASSYLSGAGRACRPEELARAPRRPARRERRRRRAPARQSPA